MRLERNSLESGGNLPCVCRSSTETALSSVPEGKRAHTSSEPRTIFFRKRFRRRNTNEAFIENQTIMQVHNTQNSAVRSQSNSDQITNVSHVDSDASLEHAIQFLDPEEGSICLGAEEDRGRRGRRVGQM